MNSHDSPDDTAVLVCIEVSWAPIPPGPSVTDHCQEPGCGAAVWVSHGSVPRLSWGETRVQCVTCTLAKIQEGRAGDVRFGLMPEQIRDLTELGILDESREFVKLMQDAADAHATHPQPWGLPGGVVQRLAVEMERGHDITRLTPRQIRRLRD